jgi:uncharacterized membrane protein YtjA (UPF0391 family)
MTRAMPHTHSNWNKHPSVALCNISIKRKERETGNLINWAIIFLIIALVAGLLGFGGLAGTAIGGAQLLFWVAIVLFIVSAVAGFMRRGV